MFVQMGVLLPSSVVACRGRPDVGGIQIGLPGCFRTQAAQRDELLEIFGVAARTLGRGRRVPDQKFELRSALSAPEVEDGHE